MLFSTIRLMPAQPMPLVALHALLSGFAMMRVCFGVMIVGNCTRRYLQGNAIATLVTGSFQDLSSLLKLYVTHRTPCAACLEGGAEGDSRLHWPCAHRGNVKMPMTANDARAACLPSWVWLAAQVLARQCHRVDRPGHV